MYDAWIVECVPCGWSGEHFTEDSAIEAAENHVRRVHADVKPEQRGAAVIGHVQLRTVVTAAEETSTAPAPLSPPDGKGDSPVSLQGDAGAGAPGSVTIETPKGETITVKE